jgi:hypothetical protein
MCPESSSGTLKSLQGLHDLSRSALVRSKFRSQHGPNLFGYWCCNVSIEDVANFDLKVIECSDR